MSFTLNKAPAAPMTDEELECALRVPGKTVKRVVLELKRVRALVAAGARAGGVSLVPLHDVLPAVVRAEGEGA